MRITFRLLAPLSILATALYLAFLAGRPSQQNSISESNLNTHDLYLTTSLDSSPKNSAEKTAKDSKTKNLTAANNTIHP